MKTYTYSEVEASPTGSVFKLTRRDNDSFVIKAYGSLWYQSSLTTAPELLYAPNWQDGKFIRVGSTLSQTLPPFKIKFDVVSKKIKLSDDYTAEVFEDKVVAGCQIIPIATVEAIVAASKEIRDASK